LSLIVLSTPQGVFSKVWKNDAGPVGEKGQDREYKQQDI
jgi:hypothetical protein